MIENRDNNHKYIYIYQSYNITILCHLIIDNIFRFCYNNGEK